MTNVYKRNTSISIFAMFIIDSASAELLCKTREISLGNTKHEIVTKCGEPEIIDAYCQKQLQKIDKHEDSITLVGSCENIDIWTYNPGHGKAAVNLYFEKDKLRDIKYGDKNDKI